MTPHVVAAVVHFGPVIWGVVAVGRRLGYSPIVPPHSLQRLPQLVGSVHRRVVLVSVGLAVRQARSCVRMVTADLDVPVGDRSLIRVGPLWGGCVTAVGVGQGMWTLSGVGLHVRVRYCWVLGLPHRFR